MKTILTVTLFAVQAGISSGQSTEPASRGPAPPAQLSLCEFRLDGTTSAGTVGTFVGGAVGGAIAASASHSYYDDAGKEVRPIYEAALKESGLFEYVGSEKLNHSEGTEALSLAGTAAENKLFACASSKPFWGVKVGWNKRVTIMTKWQVAGLGRCNLKFTTSVTSQGTYGKFPGGSDPKLKPAYLELSKEDARQFSEAFEKAATKAGCEWRSAP
jgi:hypothetical protein